VEFEFMLVLLVFGKLIRRKLSKGIKVVRTILVDTLVNIEMLSILLFNKGMLAVRT